MSRSASGEDEASGENEFVEDLPPETGASVIISVIIEPSHSSKGTAGANTSGHGAVRPGKTEVETPAEKVVEVEFTEKPSKEEPVTPSEFFEAQTPPPEDEEFLRLEPSQTERWREASRSGIAFGLLFLLSAAVLLVLGATLFGDFAPGDAERMFCALLSPLIGLVGAATGFYYGGERAGKS